MRKKTNLMGLAGKALAIIQRLIFTGSPAIATHDVYVYRLGNILLEWRKGSGFYSRLYTNWCHAIVKSKMLIWVVLMKLVFKNWRSILEAGVSEASAEVVCLFDTTLKKEIEILENIQKPRMKMMILWNIMQEEQFKLAKTKLTGKRKGFEYAAVCY